MKFQMKVNSVEQRFVKRMFPVNPGSNSHLRAYSDYLYLVHLSAIDNPTPEIIGTGSWYLEMLKAPQVGSYLEIEINAQQEPS